MATSLPTPPPAPPASGRGRTTWYPIPASSPSCSAPRARRRRASGATSARSSSSRSAARGRPTSSPWPTSARKRPWSRSCATPGRTGACCSRKAARSPATRPSRAGSSIRSTAPPISSTASPISRSPMAVQEPKPGGNGWGEITQGLVYQPLTDESFWAEKGRGAWLNERRLRVSARRDLSEALIATGIPYKAHGDFDRFDRILDAVAPEVAGIRRFGSAALDLAWVAAGRFDGFWEEDLQLWDIAAGIVLVREAGGFVTDFRGGDARPRQRPGARRQRPAPLAAAQAASPGLCDDEGCGGMRMAAASCWSPRSCAASPRSRAPIGRSRRATCARRSARGARGQFPRQRGHGRAGCSPPRMQVGDARRSAPASTASPRSATRRARRRWMCSRRTSRRARWPHCACASRPIARAPGRAACSRRSRPERRLVEGIAWDAGTRPPVRRARWSGASCSSGDGAGLARGPGSRRRQPVRPRASTRDGACSGWLRAGSSRRRRPRPPFAA